MQQEASMESLVASLVEGDQVSAAAAARLLLQNGVQPEEIVSKGLEAAMFRLDGKCTVEEFNLLEIMLAGRAVMAVMKVLYPSGAMPPATRGTVVVASLEGDVHDLGKNILKTVLLAKGYHVIDCGKDCPLDKLLDAAVDGHADAVCVSGLITSVIPQIREIRKRLALRGLPGIRVLAGGAAMKQASAEKLDVSFVGDSAFDGAKYLEAELEIVQ